MLAHGGGVPETAAILLPAVILVLVAWRLGRSAGREEREEQAEEPGRSAAEGHE